MEVLGVCDWYFCTFSNCLYALWLQMLKTCGGYMSLFAIFPILSALLGNNRPLTRVLKLPLRHQRKQCFHVAFQKYPQQACEVLPHSSCRQEAPPGLPLFLLLAEQLCLLPKLEWKLQWFWTIWCMNGQHFVEVGIAREVGDIGIVQIIWDSPNHFSHVSHVAS